MIENIKFKEMIRINNKTTKKYTNDWTYSASDNRPIDHTNMEGFLL